MSEWDETCSQARCNKPQAKDEYDVIAESLRGRKSEEAIIIKPTKSDIKFDNKLHPAIVEGASSPRTAAKPETRQSKPTKSAIRTYTGILFDFEEPEASPICIEDIAHALSLLCRFAGHCKEFYSVAEHSIRVSYNCPAEHALWGLMHDASEAYCVDVPRPLKHMPNMEHYRAHEKRVMRAICGWFNMNPVEPAEVKDADNVLLVTEQRDLLKNSIPDFNITPLLGNICPITSAQAELEFLRRFRELNKPFFW